MPRRASLRRARIDAESGAGNLFAPAFRAASGLREFGAMPKRKTAAQTHGGFEHEPTRRIPGEAFDDVSQMLFDPALGNAEHLCQLVRGTPGVAEEVDQPLPRRALRAKETHGRILQSPTREIQVERAT